MSQQFDPYRKWLGIPSQDQPPHHYRLLGISPLEDDPDVIENAANRQMQHIRTFQQGRRAAESQRILNELSAAKLCLLDPVRKSEYDKQLRTELKRRRQAGAADSVSAKQAIPDGDSAAVPVAVGVSLPSSPAGPLAQVRVAGSARPAQMVAPSRSATRQTGRGGRSSRGRRKSSAWPIVLGLIGVVVVIGIVVVAVNNGSSPEVTTTQSQPNRESTPIRPSPKRHSNASRQPARTLENPAGLSRPAWPAATPQPDDVSATPGLPLRSDPPPLVDLPASIGTSGETPADPLEPTVPAAIDGFQIAADAARAAAARRDYTALQDYVIQLGGERQTSNAAQTETYEELDMIRAYLVEFTSGLRKSLSKMRFDPETIESFGQTIVIQPRAADEQVVRFTANGESREFNLAAFFDSLRELPALEAAAIADSGLRREDEDDVLRNYRRIYVSLFLTLDAYPPDGLAKRLTLARELYESAARDGSDIKLLHKEIERAEAAANESPAEAPSDDRPAESDLKSPGDDGPPTTD